MNELTSNSGVLNDIRKSSISELEAKRADLDKEIEGYLKELGIC